MPSVRIPLVGQPNQRFTGSSGVLDKDQRFIGTMFSVYDNQITNVRTAVVEKRPGAELRATPASGDRGLTCFYNSSSHLLRVFYNTTSAISTVYAGADNGMTLMGTTDGTATDGQLTDITEVNLSGTKYWLFSVYQSDGAVAAYYYKNTTFDAGTTFTADTSNGSAVLTTVSSTTGLLVGQRITGTGIPTNTRIQSIDSSSQVTMTANATATNATVTVTRDRMAKILDPDFPQNPRFKFTHLDGFVFIPDGTNGRIYQSALNDPTSWSASEYIPTGASPLVGITRVQQYIAAFTSVGMEFYRNNGNPSGSVLIREPSLDNNIGAAQSRAIASVGDYTGFLGLHGAVYMLEGFAPKKISTPAIENTINGDNVDNNTIALVGAYWNGRPVFYLYNNYAVGPAPDYSYFYDILSGQWQETGFNSAYWLDSSFSKSETHAVSYSSTSGKNFRFSFTAPVYQDDSSGYPMNIQLGRQDLGNGNRKFLKSIELVADTQASGTTTLEISKDDFATFTTIGTFDMTKAKKIIYRCGSFVGGASLRLTHSANTAWRGEALIVDYDVGAH